MATAYEIVKSLEKTHDISLLLKRGILPFGVVTKKVYYEHYLQQLSTGKTERESLVQTSIEYQVSTMTIRRAVQFMSC